VNNVDEMTMNYPMPPPMYGSNHHSDNSTIAELRWKDHDLVAYVEEVLGGYQQFMDENGRVMKQRPDNFVPQVNDVGLSGITSFLRAHMNASIVLSNFDETKANILIKQQLDSFCEWLSINQERFEINSKDLGHIVSLIRPIVFAQVYRSVGGHETRNFHTQSFEQNVQQHSTMQNTQPGFWPWSKGKSMR
jgi:hypothetical protein